MIETNLASLRKINGISQKELANKLNISRQTLSKYETGEAIPTIDICKKIADIFGVSLDELVDRDNVDFTLKLPPRGKHAFGSMTVGSRGQIVIPVKARQMFNINPGDSLILLGDEKKGLVIIKESDFFKALNNRKEENHE